MTKTWTDEYLKTATIAEVYARYRHLTRRGNDPQEADRLAAEIKRRVHEAQHGRQAK